MERRASALENNYLSPSMSLTAHEALHRGPSAFDKKALFASWRYVASVKERNSASAFYLEDQMSLANMYEYSIGADTWQLCGPKLMVSFGPRTKSYYGKPRTTKYCKLSRGRSMETMCRGDHYHDDENS